MEIVLETRHNRDNCNKLCCEEGSSGNSFSGRVNIDDKGRGNSVLMELCCVLVIGGGLTLPRALCDICMTMRQRPLCPWEERNLQPPEGGRVASAREGGGGALAWIFFFTANYINISAAPLTVRHKNVCPVACEIRLWKSRDYVIKSDWLLAGYPRCSYRSLCTYHRSHYERIK